MKNIYNNRESKSGDKSAIDDKVELEERKS